MERFENLKEFFLEHKYVLVAGGFSVLVLLMIGIYFIYDGSLEANEEILLENVTKQDELENIFDEQEQDKNEVYQITVDIKGEVNNPGLYQLNCDSRVQDVISLAGGTTWKADTSVLNLSKKVVDEMVIVVYSKEQVSNFTLTKELEKQRQESCQNQNEVQNDACLKPEDLTDVSINDTNNNADGDTPVKSLISLNTASKEELMSLTGIGESKAENIILYREENGSFNSIEEIKNVKGIGDSIFEKIKNYITV